MLDAKFANDACEETMAAPVSETLPVPRVSEEPLLFERYRKIRELGRGGMGVVLLAHDTLLDFQVALKLIPETVVRDTEGIVDLKKEVLRGIALTHPGIVRVFSFEQDATTAAIVMEYIEGQSLAQKKSQSAGRCFDVEEILPWLEQLCAALDYAHGDARIAHRDLKPANLMLTSSGKLKVADFGIASSLSETVSRVSVRSDGSGTPPYMSPQQARGERPSHLDDIYSLGATIYELLTSRPPFFRGNVLAQVIHEEVPAMSARRDEFCIFSRAPIPEAWEKMVAACLAKEIEDRPQSGAEVLEMLKHPERAMILRQATAAAISLEGLKLEPANNTCETLEPVATGEMPPTVDLKPAVRQPVRPVRWKPEPDEQEVGPGFLTICGSAIGGFFEVVGAALKPLVTVAVVFVAIWGGLHIKGKMDANAAEREAAAKKAARLAAEAEQPAPVRPQPSQVAQQQPTVIVMPPPPPPGGGPGGPGGPPPRGFPPPRR
jgi:Protein kinase domain